MGCFLAKLTLQHRPFETGGTKLLSAEGGVVVAFDVSFQADNSSCPWYQPRRPTPRAPEPSDGTCRAWHSLPGRPPGNEGAAKNALPGNPRRPRQQSSLSQRRRPPRSFPGGAASFPSQDMLPLREMHRAGARLRDPEGRGWGPGTWAAAATATLDREPHPLTGAAIQGRDRVPEPPPQPGPGRRAVPVAVCRRRSRFAVCGLRFAVCGRRR